LTAERMTPERIAILKPCCIGDVIFTTPLLKALRRAYPNAEIHYFVGTSALPIIQWHPMINEWIDMGADLIAHARGFVNEIRSSGVDMLIVPDRSWKFSYLSLLTQVPRRVGLNSNGRGIFYTHRARIKPDEIRHEADIYLDLARVLKLDTSDCWANVPPSPKALETAEHVVMRMFRHTFGGDHPMILVHPGGGINAGMNMVVKRWLPERFAELALRVANAIDGRIIVFGGETDQDSVNAVTDSLKALGGSGQFVGVQGGFDIMTIGALASRATLYIGNDTGLTHLAAASGGKVLAIFGPSDPRRYAPYVPPEMARVAWKPVPLPARGVVQPGQFDPARDWISVDDAWIEAQKLLGV
jgi:ADP-heptose:LPS heptosyltransferase